MRIYHRVMCPNNADGTANRVDPDQTAPLIWIYTVCLDQPVRNSGSLWELPLPDSSWYYKITSECLQVCTPLSQFLSILSLCIQDISLKTFWRLLVQANVYKFAPLYLNSYQNSFCVSLCICISCYQLSRHQSQNFLNTPCNSQCLQCKRALHLSPYQTLSVYA